MKKFENLQTKTAKETSMNNNETINSSSIYDILIYIDSMKTEKLSWKVEINPLIQKPLQKNKFVIVGLLSDEDLGKNIILSNLFDIDYNSEFMLNTNGIGVKYSNNDHIICLNSIGNHTPFDFDNKSLEKMGISSKIKDEISTRKTINNRCLTNAFLGDFIAKVSDVIIILINDDLKEKNKKFIENIKMKYDSDKKIIVIHNYMKLSKLDNIEKKIEKDVILGFNSENNKIPNSDLNVFIEKNPNSNIENIIHFVLNEKDKLGLEKTFQYLKKIIKIKKINEINFDLYNELSSYFDKNYRYYLRSDSKISLNYDKTISNLIISPDNLEEVSIEIFNKIDRYMCLIEIPDFDKKTLTFGIIDSSCLMVKGIRKLNESKINFKFIIPLGPFLNNKFMKELVEYRNGILRIEVLISDNK